MRRRPSSRASDRPCSVEKGVADDRANVSTFDQCADEPPKPWAIKGVIALDENSSWFGMPGSLKSALLTDSPCTWRGASTGVPCNEGSARDGLYFALERSALTRRRLAAYARRDGVAGLPIAVTGDIIDLIDLSCIETIAATRECGSGA